MREAWDEGLRAIDRHADRCVGDAAERLEEMIRDRSYLAAVGDTHYNTAFGKMVADPMTGHLRFSPREVEAVRKVSQVEQERAMAR